MSTITSEAEAREALNKQLVELAKRAPTSLVAHAVLIHRDDQGRPIVPARHHLEWVRMMEDIDEHRWVCVVAPPGYAKSTWFSQIYPTWRIGATNGRVRIGLISNTARQSYNLAKAIQTAIESERFTKAYPNVRPVDGRWAQANSWVTGSIDQANPTLFASGMRGPVQGRRFDEIILDDPTTWDEARSETTMEGQRFWLTAMLLERFPPGLGPPDGEGRMIVVLTRWSERDLVPTLREIGFKIVTMPALGYWDRKEIGEGEILYGDEPLWPEKESREMLVAEREENEIRFELVKQGNPRILSGDVFDPANFQSAPVPSDRQAWRAEFDTVVQFVDTAGGKDRKRGDFFALATVGLKRGGEEIWIMDMERARLAAPEQERAVIRQADQWDPNTICIEDANEGIALYQRLIVSTRLPLKNVKAIRDKEFRAIPLANAYRGGRVFHPAHRDGTPHRWVRPYEMELAAFPAGPHDDQVDAAAGAYGQSAASGPRLRVVRSETSPKRSLLGGGLHRRRFK